VTTEREARLVREISTKARVHVIPNGVDTEYFQSSGTLPAQGAPVIGFTGDMSYLPNQEAVSFFARQVLPLIRQSSPQAQFLIVGRNPSREVRDLADMEGVEVTGFVPDVRTHLARMRVSVAPFSIAAGIQNKILEAMSYGLPVVVTSRTAQGLTPDAARAVEIADGPEEMAGKIVRLLRDPQLARESGQENRRRVMADYNWDKALDRFRALVENAVTTTEISLPLAPVSQQ
jgi:glycosyltransferase involved in cell wall biosynthesis